MDDHGYFISLKVNIFFRFLETFLFSSNLGGSVSLEQLEFLLNKLEFNVFAKVSEDISQKGKGTISSKNRNLKCGGFRIGRGMWKKASMSFGLVEEFAEELVKKHPDIELAAVMGKQVVRTGNQ